MYLIKHKIYILFISLIVFPFFSNDIFGQEEKQILILNSYHKDYYWSDTLMDGIISYLRDKKNDIRCEFSYEYMDAKNISNNIHMENLFNLYKNKYAGRKFDIIFSCDNDAMSFLCKYRSELFGNTPVVYCGINSYDSSRLSGQTNYTLLSEDSNLKITVDMALSLHPGTKSIFVISDSTTTGKARTAELYKIIDNYRNKVTFKVVDDISIDDLLRKVSSLPENTIVLFLVFAKDKSGHIFEQREVVSLISSKSSVPVYGLQDFHVGYGIIGGLMKSGFEHGKPAAKIGYDVLMGKNINEIPPEVEKFDKIIFDYNALKKWKVNFKRLPKGSIILNHPQDYILGHTTAIICIIAQLGIILILFYNISIRKQAEKKLHNALKLLENKNEDMQSIVYATSHDLRAPIVSILGFTKIIDESFKKLIDMSPEFSGIENKNKKYMEMNKNISDSLNFVFVNIQKMEILIEAILEVSRIGSSPISMERLDMNSVMSNVINDLSFFLKEIDTSISIDNLPPCKSDSKKINQIFTNLIMNSIKYRDPKRKLEIRIYGHVDGDSSIYCVEDNGIGIDKNFHKKIFELFQRLNPNETDGKGIGLSIIKRIVNSLNGKIWLESEKGKGSKFFISIPDS